jgi:hypothetical protein
MKKIRKSSPEVGFEGLAIASLNGQSERTEAFHHLHTRGRLPPGPGGLQ